MDEHPNNTGGLVGAGVIVRYEPRKSKLGYITISRPDLIKVVCLDGSNYVFGGASPEEHIEFLRDSKTGEIMFTPDVEPEELPPMTLSRKMLLTEAKVLLEILAPYATDDVLERISAWMDEVQKVLA